MEFQFKGANCLQITTKAGVLLTDPNLGQLGGKQPSMAKVDVCLLTDTSFRPADTGEAFVIDCPGEYEVKGFAVRGVPARSHLASEDQVDLRTVYRVSAAELNVVVFGHIYPQLSDE
ncbi:MAG TPA: MBL fold metallo-hydrolase, partial [Candidatus Saccharimonadales bacterium]|nr:MBL fold metallo-hydrolase [Candidatus Saccharimonadales bacterium]